MQSEESFDSRKIPLAPTVDLMGGLIYLTGKPLRIQGQYYKSGEIIKIKSPELICINSKLEAPDIYLPFVVFLKNCELVGNVHYYDDTCE